MHSQNTPNLLRWIKQTFPYPHCQKLSTPADLKTGIAAAEILSDLVPEQYQAELLRNVEVGKLNADTCVANWRTIIGVVGRWVREGAVGIAVVGYTGEGLYYREQELWRFVGEVLMKLWEYSKTGQPARKQQVSYSNTIMAHLLLQQQQPEPAYQTEPLKRVPRKQNSYLNGNVNLSQLSDIANTSSPDMVVHVRNGEQKEEEIEDEEVGQQYPRIQPQQLQQLQQYITQRLSIPTHNFLQPHQLLGQLVNKTFSSSRLSTPIIKQAHFTHGPLFVYRRLLDFLINDHRAERVAKGPVLQLMRSVEERGVVREMGFWRVVGVLRDFQMARGRGRGSHGNSVMRKSKQMNKQKQNLHPNMGQLAHKPSQKTLSKCKTSKQTLTQQPTPNTLTSNFKPNKQDILQTEQWLTKQLGLQHTLSKIHQQNQLLSNVLLNGVFVASLFARLRIGKVGVSRECGGLEVLRRNWEAVAKLASLRGYQSLKPITAILHGLPANPDCKQLINIFLHILNQFRLEHNKKCPPPTTTTSQVPPKQCNNCPPDTTLTPSPSPLTHSSKLQLLSWLQHTFSLQLPPPSPTQPLTTSQLTQICKQLLNLNIYKETTKKIQENNVEKILGELRRIGLSAYYGLTRVQVLAEEGIRWRILGDLRWLIEGKIEFCRA